MEQSVAGLLRTLEGPSAEQMDHALRLRRAGVDLTLILDNLEAARVVTQKGAVADEQFEREKSWKQFGNALTAGNPAIRPQSIGLRPSSAKHHEYALRIPRRNWKRSFYRPGADTGSCKVAVIRGSTVSAKFSAGCVLFLLHSRAAPYIAQLAIVATSSGAGYVTECVGHFNELNNTSRTSAFIFDSTIGSNWR